jgi:5-methylcytosine-specific restriction endonuclease McrA
MADWHNSTEWAKARAYAKTILEPQCVTCGKHLEGGDWTIDHIIPAGSDGVPNHNLENLQSMCRECNGRKQDRVYARTTWRNPRWN